MPQYKIRPRARLAGYKKTHGLLPGDVGVGEDASRSLRVASNLSRQSTRQGWNVVRQQSAPLASVGRCRAKPMPPVPTRARRSRAAIASGSPIHTSPQKSRSSGGNLQFTFYTLHSSIPTALGSQVAAPPLSNLRFTFYTFHSAIPHHPPPPWDGVVVPPALLCVSARACS